MRDDALKKIIESRRPKAEGGFVDQLEREEDKFYSALVGDAYEEQFLEFRFKGGLRVCVSYNELVWFDYDPETGILDLEFGVMLVVIEGRGIGEKLFEDIKRKKVSWIKEADTEMQDHDSNTLFIREIRVVLPETPDSDEK